MNEWVPSGVGSSSKCVGCSKCVIRNDRKRQVPIHLIPRINENHNPQNTNIMVLWTIFFLWCCYSDSMMMSSHRARVKQFFMIRSSLCVFCFLYFLYFLHCAWKWIKKRSDWWCCVCYFPVLLFTIHVHVEQNSYLSDKKTKFWQARLDFRALRCSVRIPIQLIQRLRRGRSEDY